MLTLKEFKTAALKHGKYHEFKIHDIKVSIKINNMLVLCMCHRGDVVVDKLMVSNTYCMHDVVRWIRHTVNHNSVKVYDQNTSVTDHVVLTHVEGIIRPIPVVSAEPAPTYVATAIYAQETIFERSDE